MKVRGHPDNLAALGAPNPLAKAATAARYFLALLPAMTTASSTKTDQCTSAARGQGSAWGCDGTKHPPPPPPLPVNGRDAKGQQHS